MRFGHTICTILVAGGSLLLAGCQSSPPVIYDVPASQAYDRESSAIWPELIEAATAEGLVVVEAKPALGW